jgi:hypothetical protein
MGKDKVVRTKKQDLQEGQKVYWNREQFPVGKGYGYIRGIVAGEMSVIGKVYIVETDYLTHDYPYTHMAIPEMFFTKVERMKE